MKTYIQKYRVLTLLILGLTLGINDATSVQAGVLFLNAFRNPSIGLEYRENDVSIHSGFYTTILNESRDDGNQPQWFVRSGLTVWPKPYAYASLSFLHGLERERAGYNFMLYEVGGQYEATDWLVLRLGVAFLAAKDGFQESWNPTPGLSIRVQL